MKRYNPKEIEPKWQQIWDEQQTYHADLASDKPKYFAMSMFNYPSGHGIHIGHAMNYTISDVMARFKRQQGYESYHPVGWDAFGLPAENYAIKTGVSPQESMASIIPGYHAQYKAMGWSNDWSKEIATCDPEYYKWTQWIFWKMYEQGMVYQDERLQWWCTKCQTVLSNEQVIDGKCWRHDAADDPEVGKKAVKQWFFRITDYANEMLEATHDLDWSEAVKTAQINWIGKSEGAEVTFALANDHESRPNFVILHGFTGHANAHFIPRLKSDLESRGYQVQAPQMPNTDNPVEAEQVNYVLENCTFDKDTVLIGHSLGGAVAIKVLEKLDHPIESLVLVAPVVEPAFRGENYKNENPNRPPRLFVDTFDISYDYDQIVAKTKSRIVLSDAMEVKRKPYLDYLAPKIDAALHETTAAKIHFTSGNEPFILEVLDSCLLTRASDKNITVFTTRPDTLYGATFLVLAPEHELVRSITTDEQRSEIEAYITEAEKKSEVERQESKDKTGVFTGAYAVNPVNNQNIPIWIADYVLTGYGTGAIMAVPAHDERDNEFAQKFDLPITQVIAPYIVYDDEEFAPRDGLDNLKRRTVDAIITDGNNNYLLETEDEKNVHFVGGGVDKTDADDIAALRREIAEEVGFTNIASIKMAAPYNAAHAYRKTKNVNQVTWGQFYEVTLGSLAQERSEIEDGKHSIMWVTKEEVAAKLTWKGHATAWNHYINGSSEVFHQEGLMVNSGEYDGMESAKAREQIVQDLEGKGLAKFVTNFRIRDWSVARQRYWGAPVPIINCPVDGQVLVPEQDLPVVLPELKDFAPSGDGRSALARATDWLKVDCPKCGGPAERETDTLDTYICSSWYFLRYLDPHNSQAAFGSNVANKWMPVDFYNGGDHATAHMIYARFVTRFFHKLGLLAEPEPFKKFLFNGKVTASDGTMFSKSKGNGVDPLEIIGQGYGADALRTYLMFAAPLELWMRWDAQGVPGTYRFLNRVWNLTQEFCEFLQGQDSSFVAKAMKDKESREQDGLQGVEVLQAVHPVIRKVTSDLEQQKYNTAIASMMELTNTLYTLKKNGFTNMFAWQFALESLAAMIAPFAPHTADELWHDLGRTTSVQRDSWPLFDEQYLARDTITLAVQVNGKLRGTIEVPADTDQPASVEAAKQNDKIVAYLDGHEIIKTIFVPGKLINFVVR